MEKSKSLDKTFHVEFGQTSQIQQREGYIDRQLELLPRQFNLKKTLSYSLSTFTQSLICTAQEVKWKREVQTLDLQVQLCILYAISEAKMREKTSASLIRSKWKQMYELQISKIQQKLNHQSSQFDELSQKFFKVCQVQNGSLAHLRHSYREYFCKIAHFLYQKVRNLWFYFAFNAFRFDRFDESSIDSEKMTQVIKKVLKEIFSFHRELQWYRSCERKTKIEETMKETCFQSSQQNQLTCQILTMMTIESDQPSQKQSKTRLERYGFSLKPINFRPGIKIKDIMLLQMNLETITLVDRCEPYQQPYLLFEIPFCLLLAETLTYYDQNHKSLYIYHLMIAICQKINRFRKRKAKQLSDEEVMNCLVTILNYRKYTSEQIRQQLRDFLERNSDRMKAFIPFYFQIFSFHACEKYQFIESISSNLSAKEKREEVKRKIEQIYEICQKYNSEYL